MASLTQEGTGNWKVQFVCPLTGKRKAIRIGGMPKRIRLDLKRRVEDLVNYQKANMPWDGDLAAWVEQVGDDLAEKLAGVGLIEPRTTTKLAEFIDRFVDGRKDVKPASKTVWRQGRNSLVERLGAERNIRDVSPSDAEEYKQWLIEEGLALYTVRKRLQAAKMFFTAMVKRKLILANPFDGVQVAAIVDTSRNKYIPRSVVEKVMVEAPDAEWRAIVALSRFAGLRCPSEVLSLKWEHIDWEHRRITVPSPKTEHHAEGGQRLIPLFPQLMRPLMEAFELAPDGAVFVVTKHRAQAESAGGWKNSNLRTRFQKMIRKAGAKPWPKPFHALRASCETDLLEDYPIQTVSAWLGHSPKVALAHYARVLPEHFDRAAGVSESVSVPYQNADQHESAAVSNDPQESLQTLCDCTVTPFSSELCGMLQEHPADGEGFEPPVDSRPQRFSRPPP